MNVKYTTEELLNEWQTLFEEGEEFYIYGAANTARQLMKVAKETGVDNKVKGFLVSDKNGNPKMLEGLPVIDIHTFRDKKVDILIPHSGVYKREIFCLLETLGFSKMHHIHRFMHLFVRNEKKEIKDVYMDEAAKQIYKIHAEKTSLEKEQDKLLREEIARIRLAEKPDFGHAEVYQSFEIVGILGTRPTLYRILKYGLEDILSKKHEVLDIGCNCGFLDMSVSELVNTITGVEYEASLVTIANHVKRYLGKNNCNFINSDFHDWYAENTNNYDVIFSFAIHHWLNLEPRVYVKKLDEILKSGGHICFESHDLTNGLDTKYEMCIEELLNLKYEIHSQGEIMDDGITPRKFIVLSKIK